MLKTTFMNANGDELILVKLKQQLAKLTCKCKICEKYNTNTLDEERVHAERCIKIIENSSRILESSCKENCPGCFVAYSLLKNGTKTYKDEDTSISRTAFCANKCIQKSVRGVERTTSMSLEHRGTGSTVNISDSLDSISNRERRNCKRTIEKVTFSTDKPKISEPIVYGTNCLCLENFIDSIRPSLYY